ncbi:MAG: hypothetical protein JWN76_2197 [Chitinophagaceae bacterium]|nr:hypothetical protein [Chitinophagaceae bacterium]
MNHTRRITGLLCILIAVAAIVILITSAVHNIESGGKTDISKPIPWIIIIAVFTPIAAGLAIFGWYAWKKEYNNE